MASTDPLKRALPFCLALLVAVPACLVLWGLILPWYAGFLAASTKAVLNVALGFSIDRAVVQPGGLFNTRTMLVYTLGERHPSLDVGALAFNIPPFVALVAVTPGLAWRRRLKALGAGIAILAVGHVIYIVMTFSLAGTIAESPQIPTALGELFLSLPFLLWIVLCYWERLAALLHTTDIST